VEEGEFEALLELSTRALRPSLERVGRFDPERRRARFRAAFKDGGLRAIQVGEVLAGCVGVRRHPDHLEIHGFYLDPALQGRGLGTAVLRALLAEAPEMPVRLEVLRHSDAARFYERHGFQRTGEAEFDWLYALPARGTA